MRQSAMFNPPVPCFNTFFTTLPISGLRARIMGSHAGLSAVPYPFHCTASGVAGSVRYASVGIPTTDILRLLPPALLPAGAARRPVTFRFAPAALSIAFDMFVDLGKP